MFPADALVTGIYSFLDMPARYKSLFEAGVPSKEEYAYHKHNLNILDRKHAPFVNIERVSTTPYRF